MTMCDELNVRLLVTMNADERAQKMYSDRLNAKVICLPSGAVDSELFFPWLKIDLRDIDVGYRAYDDPVYFLHNDSRKIAEYFIKAGSAAGLRMDISMESSDRFTGSEWAGFLNRCRGQIGVERGTDVFELTDALRIQVNDYCENNPESSKEEVFKLFLPKTKNSVSGRMLTGRHTEAAACGCVQILFEGRYNDYFKADEHYIPLRSDFGNFTEVIEKYNDLDVCAKITKNAQEVVLQNLTYERLIGKFHKYFSEVI